MQKIKNILISGAAGKPMAVDIFFKENDIQKPVVLYAHGFNGFKDWGNADLIAEKFATAGFVFVKFNFSHNGTTPEHPEEFVDLEAFGNNNYTKQLFDLDAVINWVADEKNSYANNIDTNNIFLIGHSMGGGIATLQAAKDERIKKLITWAGISECKTPWTNWSTDKIDEWKQTGVAYYLNGRTKQQMPMYYQLHQDYVQNEASLHIQNAISSLNIPVLICHGTLDTSVPLEKAHDLLKWQPAATLFTVESDHVFGRAHPWTSLELPEAMLSVVEKTIAFLQL